MIAYCCSSSFSLATSRRTLRVNSCTHIHNNHSSPVSTPTPAASHNHTHCPWHSLQLQATALHVFLLPDPAPRLHGPCWPKP
jgi:hypothetical protein